MLPRLTVITGNGKGKTTAAMGRAALAAWTGEKVLVIQFLKGTGYTGELQSAEQWSDHFVIKQFGAGCLHSAEIRQGLGECRRCGSCFRANKLPENRFVDQAFDYARQAVESGQWDLLVLDEVSHAINKGLLDLTEFVAWLQVVTPKVRLVLTGRNMPLELIAMADEATSCEMVKHPISQGIFGRWGVGY